MADVETEMRALALLGARTRLVELDGERDRLLAMFPELASRKYKPREAPTAGASGPQVLFDAEVHAPKRKAKSKARPAPRKFTDEDRAEILDELRTDYLIDVSKKWDIADSVLRNWCKKAKIKPRKLPRDEAVRRQSQGRAKQLGKITPSPKKAKKGTRQHFSDEEKAKAVARVKAGETIGDVARELGVNDSNLRRWCVAAKVSTRMPREERSKRAKASGSARHGIKGAWGGTIAIKSRKTRPEVPSDKREALLKRVAAGESPTRVAKELGVNPATARGWFARSKGAKAGITLAKGPRKIPAETREALIDRVKKGENGTAVARELGVLPVTARNWLSDAGVHSKRAPRNPSNGVYPEST